MTKEPVRLPWTAAEDAIITEDWLTHTAEAISLRLGRTRNGIIGRARRLRLPPKESGFGAANRQKKDPNYRAPAPKLPPPKFAVRVAIQSLPPSVPTDAEAIPLLESQFYQCKAIMSGKDKHGLAMVCGRPFEPGQPYSFCSYHLAKYTQKRSA